MSWPRKTPRPICLADALNNLGVLDRAQKRIREARKAFEEALEIRRELAQKNPEAYLPGVAETLNNLGVLSRVQKRTEEARKDFEEALQIYETLAKQDSEQFSRDVTRVKKVLEEVHK